MLGLIYWSLWPRPCTMIRCQIQWWNRHRTIYFYSMCSLFFQWILFCCCFIQLQKISMTASMKKITWCVIYLIKVNYTSYNYTSYKSTWRSPINKTIGVGTHNGFLCGHAKSTKFAVNLFNSKLTMHYFISPTNARVVYNQERVIIPWVRYITTCHSLSVLTSWKKENSEVQPWGSLKIRKFFFNFRQQRIDCFHSAYR